MGRRPIARRWFGSQGVVRLLGQVGGLRELSSALRLCRDGGILGFNPDGIGADWRPEWGSEALIILSKTWASLVGCRAAAAFDGDLRGRQKDEILHDNEYVHAHTKFIASGCLINVGDVVDNDWHRPTR